MGRHSAKVIPISLQTVPQKKKITPEYSSWDIEFDWPEAYAPPFPLTEKEKRLAEMNNAQEPSPDLIDVILDESVPSAGWAKLNAAYLDRLIIRGKREG